MNIIDVIVRPIISEKGTTLQSLQQYLFHVNSRATKPMIRNAVEQLFKVKVVDVRTATIAGKSKRVDRRGTRVAKPSWKKAVVTLADGHKLDFIEGV